MKTFLFLFCFFLVYNTVSAQSSPSLSGTGQVIAIRELKLKPGIDSIKFERFALEKYNPGMKGAAPGVQNFITKVERGQKKGGYALIYIFDTQKTLLAIAPDTGKTADWFLPFWEKVVPLVNELSGYLEAGWDAIYNDYFELR